MRANDIVEFVSWCNVYCTFVY